MNQRRLAALAMHALTASAVLGLSAIHAVRHDYAVFGTSRFPWTLAYLGLLVIVSYSFGLPEASDSRSPSVRALTAALIATFAFAGLQLALGEELVPRFVLLGTVLLATVGWTLLTRRSQRAARRGEEDRVCFVGTAEESRTLRHDLETSAERNVVIVASEAVASCVPISPSEEPLVDVAISASANIVVLGRTATNERSIIRQASMLHESGVRVRSLVDFYDQWLGKLPVSELERLALMFDIREIHHERYARMKRLIDVIVALIGCAVVALMIPFVWVINLFGNRGPLFYRQPRVGRAHRTFDIVKFRTMRAGETTDWTAESDPRVTPFGRVLRRTHLDEAPQFFNVLRGDLSIVGPRPEQPQYVDMLTECLPFYALRHLVRPGLTGWAQVKYGYAANERDALEKLQYDVYYLGHQSHALDFRIIARTLRTMIGTKGR